MVKSKGKTKNVEKEVEDVIQYASKEEEEEFLKFSDDEKNSSESQSDIDMDSSIHVPKACDVDMSDDEEDDLDEDKLSEDNLEDMYVDSAEEDEDSESVKPLDRKASKELGKAYAEKNRRTIFVGNISAKVTKKVLLQLFNSKKAAGEGAVETIRIRGAVAPDQSLNNRAKRKAVILKNYADNENQVLCAFVVLKKEEDVEKCLSLNGHLIDGRHIRVDKLKGKKLSYNPSNCIFIGNLPFNVDEEQVREAFEKTGEIINVRLVRNKADGKVKGIGYVEFTESFAVDFALKLSGTMKIGDRIIRIQKWTKSKTQKGKREASGGEKKKSFKKKVVAPSNLKGIELKEFVYSKQKKMLKKAEKKKNFIKCKKEAKVKNK